MKFFDKIKGCQILKKGSNAENEILELKEILDTCPESEKKYKTKYPQFRVWNKRRK